MCKYLSVLQAPPSHGLALSAKFWSEQVCLTSMCPPLWAPHHPSPPPLVSSLPGCPPCLGVVYQPFHLDISLYVKALLFERRFI